MSSIVNSITGGAGGAGGTGFAAPGGANVVNAATKDQADQLYGQAQTGINNQAGFLQAVQAQNGLGNQSNVFNQLSGIASGQGPNPAQAMLNQATGANVANQAAMMAGQRGAGQNAGMMARQAAQQGAATQQQAAGQGATMQANQSMQAIGQMGQMANTQAAQQAAATGAYTGAVQGEQGQILGAIGNQNSANVGIQSNINSTNANLANTRMGQQGQLVGNMMGGVGSALGLAQGGEVKRYAYGDAVESSSMPVGQSFSDSPFQDQASAPATSPMAPQAPVAPAQQTSSPKPGPKSRVGQYHDESQPKLQGMAAAGDTLGKGIGAGLKAGYNALFGSKDNNAPGTQPGDQVAKGQWNSPQANSGAGAFDPNAYSSLSNVQSAGQTAGGAADTLAQPTQELNPDRMLKAARGGLVPAMVSPGERYLSPEAVDSVKAGADPIKAGKKIPGKAKVKGAKNSYANDTVPATLREGGIVLPRSVTESKHPHWAAHKFVAGIMAKQALKQGK